MQQNEEEFAGIFFVYTRTERKYLYILMNEFLFVSLHFLYGVMHN